MSGDNIANDLENRTSGNGPNFLHNTLGAVLVAGSYRDYVGHPPLPQFPNTCRKVTTERGCADFEDDMSEDGAIVYLYGSACPERYDYDVLDVFGATGRNEYAAIYDHTDVDYPPCGLGAGIFHWWPVGPAPTDTVRTLIDGYSLHALRDGGYTCGPAYPPGGYWLSIALKIRDMLGGNYPYPPPLEVCYFYDRADSVQYCPPRYEDQAPTGLEPPGRTYVNALFQNYPNPFRSSSGTTIHYSVAKACRVEVRIFDVAGRLVNTIVDQSKPGSNFVVWDGKANDGRRVASGVYFYQIKTDGFSDQKKMMLVN